MLNIRNKTILLILPAILLITACSKLSGPAALFKKRSPHDIYVDNLKAAGLDRSEMGRQWLGRSASIAAEALAIKIPYKETGYFAPEKTQAAMLSFNAIKGQKVNITLTKKPTVNFNIYLDVFEQTPNNELERVAFADTAGTAIDFEVDNTGKYYLRLQPELLSGGQYTLSITAGPSLGFPVTASARPRIGSFFGDGRDAGDRLHEGIDIFAPKKSAAIAAANGVVTSVRENNLGGKVVFMRPEGKNYSLYYAHLDSQLVNAGESVNLGDTLGLVGNTGNARLTPSHLHFGVYTGSGAVDPIYFVDKEIKKPATVTASINLLNSTARVNKRATVLDAPFTGSNNVASLPTNTPLVINAAAAGWYKVTMPDGKSGYIQSNVVSLASSLKKITLKNKTVLFNSPDSLKALAVAAANSGSKVELLGTYKNYSLVKWDDNAVWIPLAN